MHKSRNPLLSALDATERKLFGERQRFQNHVDERIDPPAPLSTPRRGLLLVAVVAVLGGMATLFVDTITIGSRVTDNPAVFNINRAGVKTAVRRGLSPQCGPIECWLQELAETDSNWTMVDVPHVLISRLFDSPAKPFDHYYYRLSVPVPLAWRDGHTWLAFTPFYIVHDKAEVFIDGVRLGVRDGGGSASEAMSIPVPPEMLKDGILNIAIKGDIALEDRGIFHRRDFYLGPKGIVDQVVLVNERLNRALFQIYFYSTASIFFVLALPYLFGRSRRGSAWFMLFAGASCLENLIRGDFFASEWLPVYRIGCFYCFRVLALAGLTGFTADFLRLRWRTAILSRLTIIAVVTVAAATVDSFYGTRSFSGGDLFNVTNSLLVAWAVAATALGILRVIRSIRSGRQQSRIFEESAFVVVLGSYAALLIWEFVLGTFRGYDPRSTADLVLLFFVAVVNVRLGTHQDRVLAKQNETIQQLTIDRAVANMTRMLAHDVRKPYKRLLYALSDARSRFGSNNTELTAHLKSLETEIKGTLHHVDAMIQDVLSTTLTVGQVSPEPVSLNAIIRDLGIDQQDAPLRYAFVKLRSDHRKMPLALPTPLYRSLLNLVENAVEASPSGANVTVTTSELTQPPRIIIKVHNSGSEIPEEDLQRLFEPGFTSRKQTGTGLGLAIVKRFLDACGGSISCQSAKDVGTAFTVTLPASDVSDYPIPLPQKSQDSLPAQRSALVSQQTQPMRIIGVDDDPFVQEAWRRALGLNLVAVFNNPEHLIEVSKAGHIQWDEVDVLITDNNFTGTNKTGADIAQFIHSLTNSTKFSGVILLATDDLSVQKFNLPPGIDDVIAKDEDAIADILSRSA